jgi:hypothetical protein
MTFLGMLWSVVRRQFRRPPFTGLAILGHLNDDLNPALIGDPDREQLANGGGQGVLTATVEGRCSLGLGSQRCRSLLMRPARQGAEPGRLGDRLLVRLAILKAIPDVGDRELIPWPQTADLDALTIDPDAVGTTQVPHDHFAVLLRHTAMMPRHPERIQAGITRRMTAHHHHGTVQRDVWTFIEGHQSCGHGKTSSIDNLGGAALVPSRHD